MLDSFLQMNLRHPEMRVDLRRAFRPRRLDADVREPEPDFFTRDCFGIIARQNSSFSGFRVSPSFCRTVINIQVFVRIRFRPIYPVLPDRAVHAVVTPAFPYLRDVPVAARAMESIGEPPPE